MRTMRYQGFGIRDRLSQIEAYFYKNARGDFPFATIVFAADGEPTFWIRLANRKARGMTQAEADAYLAAIPKPAMASITATLIRMARS